ncbi:MAG: heparinase [Butyrivibrio sp.]|nr:heparinase [Butyrivibrio sp.]
MIFEYMNTEVLDCLKWEMTLPRIDDRNFWGGLSEDLKKAIIQEGEKQKEKEWSVILLEDYRRFYKDGDRISFEDKSFSRRVKLSALVLAECVQNEGNYLDDILNGMYLILEESSWCHPAHNSHIRDEKPTNVPDTSEPVIDLFAAETGAVIGVCEYLLRPVLVSINPIINEYVNGRIMERLILPYISKHYWWMYDENEKAINWTPWITQNILLSVFTRGEGTVSKEQVKTVFEKAVKSADYFIDSYGDDGCCDEGALYYSHAGLCLYGILDIINDVSENAFAEVFEQSKIKNIASYIRKIYVDDGYYINYADCPAKAGNRTAREFLFGKACGDMALCALAADDYRVGDWDVRLLNKEHNLWYKLLQVMCHEEIMRFRQGSGLEENDVFFESAGLMITRNDKFVLAAKAGNNADSHNHNDVGSITLYKFGKPFLIDLGVETYTSRTFSDRRYEIWTMQSVYHNLPTFYDGHETVTELPGEKYAAKDVVYNQAEHKLSMDIAPAFGSKNIFSYVRTVSLRGEKVFMDDSYDGILDGVLGFMTYEEPVVKGEKDGNIIIAVGALGEIKLVSYYKKPEEISIERCQITDERLKETWKHDCFRIRVPFKKGMIKVEFY